jgi:Uma2 family endonuclease
MSMGQAAEVVKFTAAEFLVWDADQTIRHEYLDGDVFAMAGGQDTHATLALNAAMALRQHLNGTPCRVFVSDVKLQVEAANCFFYPDVFVTCGEADRASRLIKREAKLVIEVLSPSTAAYDRGEKFARYRQLETLEEVVLIDPDTRRSDVFRRAPEGRWLLQPYEGHEVLELTSVGLRIAPAVLYADVDG